MHDVCNISNKYRPPSKLPKYQYFYTRDFIPLLHFPKELVTLHRTCFSKHPFFTIFSLFLSVSEVCNISNKYCLHNKSAQKVFLHKNLTPFLHFRKNCAPHCRIFKKYPPFTTILLVFRIDEVCNISNKYHSPSNLAKYQYFYTREFISFLHFEK